MGLVLRSKAEKLCFSGWRQEHFRISIIEEGVGKNRGRLGTTVTKKACANLMESCGVGRALTEVPDSDKEPKLNLHQAVIGCRLQILG